MLVLKNMSICKNEVFMWIHITIEGGDSQQRWMAKYVKDDSAYYIFRKL